MGQYYKAVFLTEQNKPTAFVSPYDFGGGAKLMEHSWIESNYVRFVEAQLIIEPKKMVWAGDYADVENPTTLTKDEIRICSNPDYPNHTEEYLKENGVNIYTLCDTISKLIHDEDIKDRHSHEFKSIAPLKAKYLVNHDKKEFVDKSKTPKDSDGWQIHPLPLLTCEGNGRGSGDFRGENENLIGRWSRDKIGVVPRKSDIPKGFTEVTFDISE